jgi:hypothetical protein
MASPETVRVYTIDENSDPLEGVLIRFFDNTDTFVTQQYSSLAGGESYGEVTIDGDDPPIDYTIRLGKDQVAFDGSLGDDSKTPQAIQVYSPASLAPTGTNYFQVQAQTFTRPVSSDPRLCKCSGFFVDPTGRPLPNMDIHFIHRCPYDNLRPIIVDGKGVLGQKVYGRTDSNGYMEIELFRTGEYSATVQGFEDINRYVIVPDASSENLVDLLFPIVESLTFSTSPLSLTVGQYEDLTLTITASNGVVLDPMDGDVTFTCSDTSVASIQLLSTGLLRVLAVSAGAATITAERVDTSIKVIPDEDISYTPLAVTVT